MGPDEIGNPKVAAIVSGHQIVEEIEVMQVHQVDGRIFCRKARAKGKKCPRTRGMNGKITHLHAFPPDRAIRGHRQFLGPSWLVV